MIKSKHVLALALAFISFVVTAAQFSSNDKRFLFVFVTVIIVGVAMYLSGRFDAIGKPVKYRHLKNRQFIKIDRQSETGVIEIMKPMEFDIKERRFVTDVPPELLQDAGMIFRKKIIITKTKKTKEKAKKTKEHVAEDVTAIKKGK
jgi:hypothetical protein